MHCRAMDVYCCRVLLGTLPSKGLYTQNRSPREDIYRAMGLYVTVLLTTAHVSYLRTYEVSAKESPYILVVSVQI